MFPLQLVRSICVATAQHNHLTDQSPIRVLLQLGEFEDRALPSVMNHCDVLDSFPPLLAIATSPRLDGRR
jgi:hypothetical protein